MFATLENERSRGCRAVGLDWRGACRRPSRYGAGFAVAFPTFPTAPCLCFWPSCPENSGAGGEAVSGNIVISGESCAYPASRFFSFRGGRKEAGLFGGFVSLKTPRAGHPMPPPATPESRHRVFGYGIALSGEKHVGVVVDFDLVTIDLFLALDAIRSPHWHSGDAASAKYLRRNDRADAIRTVVDAARRLHGGSSSPTC